jgi:type IV pilus assembly protein PilX
MSGHQPALHRMAAHAGARRQRGVVMWVALGVLIIMTLTGLAMLRQMGGGLSIAGNVAFKQGTTIAADLGTERARVWYTTSGVSTDNDVPAAGYYASWGSSADPKTFNWDDAPSATDSANNTVQYVIHRLCATSGPVLTQKCASESPPSSDKGCKTCFTSTKHAFFRVTTKVTGPRNTVSYIQVILD